MSWRPEADSDALSDAVLWSFLGGSLLVAVLLPTFGSRVLGYAYRHQVNPGSLDWLLLVVTVLTVVCPAAAVFAAAATRLPFVGVAIALVALVLIALIERLASWSMLLSWEVGFWLLIGGLGLLGIDLAVYLRRGRSWPLSWAIAGAAVVAVLEFCAWMLNLLTHGASLGDLAVPAHVLFVQVFLGPLLIVGSAALGWVVGGSVRRSAQTPPAGG